MTRCVRNRQTISLIIYCIRLVLVKIVSIPDIFVADALKLRRSINGDLWWLLQSRLIFDARTMSQGGASQITYTFRTIFDYLSRLRRNRFPNGNYCPTISGSFFCRTWRQCWARVCMVPTIDRRKTDDELIFGRKSFSITNRPETLYLLEIIPNEICSGKQRHFVLRR